VSLKAALGADLALANLEETLIRAARQLHRKGFTSKNLRPSQMAAVGELIRSAPNQGKAVGDLGTWLGKQLEKLRAKEERSGRKSSWLVEPNAGAGGESEDSLGQELLRCVTEQRYLRGQETKGLDPLTALQCFWAYFHGLYRYQNEVGEEMPLAALDLGKGGEPPHE